MNESMKLSSDRMPDVGGTAVFYPDTLDDLQTAQTRMDEIIGNFQRMLQEQRNIKVQFAEILTRLQGQSGSDTPNQKESRLDPVAPEGHLIVLDLIHQHMVEEHDALIHIYERFKALL